MSVEKTPLEDWIKQKICSGAKKELIRKQLEEYQLVRLKEMIARVKIKSRFYRQQLADVNPDKLTSLKDIRFLPFTRVKDLQENPNDFACVSQKHIKKIITVSTSGTTGEPKRFFFADKDQEQTVDFFQHGMKVFTRAEDRVLIMLPGERPGSVGHLLNRAIERLEARSIQHDLGLDFFQTLQFILRESITVLVGNPVQVFQLARRSDSEFCRHNAIKNILLSTDNVPGAIVREIENKWNCRVFNHYGMTEMGLGGGVQCEALAGYHLREADFLFEIVNPESGETVPDGEYGEIVFTSLTAEAMPFVRYRTGDISRFLPEPCPCGTVLKSLDIVSKRINGKINLENGSCFWLSELDEILFSLPFVLNYKASITKREREECLNLSFQLWGCGQSNWQKIVAEALKQIPALSSVLSRGRLRLNIEKDNEELKQVIIGKRIIKDFRFRY